MTFSCPRLTLADVLALARRCGYDGIEPRTVSGHAHGVELDADAARRAEIRKSAEAAGVAICCVATSLQYADPALAATLGAETRAYIDLAADVGCPRIRVFGGLIPEGVERRQATDGMVAALGSVADYAAKRGVVICVETHDDWCNPDHLAEVMRRVDHPAVGVNWDIMHPVCRAGATIESAFATLRPWIRHVHFHDGRPKEEGDGVNLVPVGEGIVDHRRAVELLLGAGYDGYLSGEWINWEPYDVHLPRELATMKRYERAAARGQRGPRR